MKFALSPFSPPFPSEVLISKQNRHSTFHTRIFFYRCTCPKICFRGAACISSGSLQNAVVLFGKYVDVSFAKVAPHITTSNDDGLINSATDERTTGKTGSSDLWEDRTRMRPVNQPKNKVNLIFAPDGNFPWQRDRNLSPLRELLQKSEALFGNQP